jgi:hypothetical protein
MASRDELPRQVLPIPDHPTVGPTPFDARDQETRYPPFVICGPLRVRRTFC